MFDFFLNNYVILRICKKKYIKFKKNIIFAAGSRNRNINLIKIKKHGS